MKSKYQILAGEYINGKGIPFVFITANDFRPISLFEFKTEYFILFVDYPTSANQKPHLIKHITKHIRRECIGTKELLKKEKIVAERCLKFLCSEEQENTYKAELREYNESVLMKLCANNQKVKSKIREIMRKTLCDDLKDKLSSFYSNSLYRN